MALGSALGSLIAVRFGWSPSLPAYLFLLAVSIPLVVLDLRFRRLPAALVTPFYPITFALLAAASAGQGRPWSLLKALAGMGVLVGFYLLRAATGGLGLGDVRLAGLLGLYLGWLGWTPLVAGTPTGLVLAGLTGAILMVAGRATRRTRLPFGPFMTVGAFVAILT